MKKKYINLLQSHEPLMDSGDYEITVEQTLTVVTKNVDEAFAPTKRKFSVFGERYFLEPGSVHSVYPPMGSQGEHSNTFPHLILNRSTLPWERSADGGRDGIWLALLLFDESEIPEIQTITLGDFKNSIGAFSEMGDGPDEQPISVIDVPRGLLEKLMPTRADLDFTAHTRRETANAERGKVEVIGPERAVIIGNRLPQVGALSTVHLVSLENRFENGGEFDFSLTNADGSIRLLSLKSWSFTSVAPKFSLFGMIEHLDRSPSILSQPLLNGQVLRLRMDDLTDGSGYGFQITATGTRFTRDEVDQYRLFDETSHLSVEVPDNETIDADKDPQLDPFPNPEAFSIALDLRVLGGGGEVEKHALMGKAENGKYKPSLWYVPGIHGLEYRVTGEDGTTFGSRIPGVLQANEFIRLVWVKKAGEFQFYVNGFLAHTAEAPGRIFTKDSNYFIGKVDDESVHFSGHIRYLNIFRRALRKRETETIFTSQAGNAAPPVNARLEKGMLALPHLFRQGKKGVSWYRGPLSVRTSNPGFKLPAVAADQLLVFDENLGLFDVSYAAAWQLGRLMALEDRRFSLDLYRVKRQISLDKKREGQIAGSHLNLGKSNLSNGLDEVKKRVRNWMRRRHVLEQVPFHYLVPQADMLPDEGIRFFHLDPTWVRCLKDGAASIGRTTSADFALDEIEDFAAEAVPFLSGFLLRSELVAGYPGLQVAGYAFGQKPDRDNPLPVARMERLSDRVLLCLFEGEVHTVDFFQKPDVLHFGLDSDGVHFSKQLRKADGSDLANVPALELKAQHFHDKELRIFNFKKMASGSANSLKGKLKAALPPADFKEFETFTSADFAMEMMEGAERVRFVRGE